ncbi:hypothetical protein [Micromonospora sediminimaris]|uniref:hypothetical protein n=1 Tax=Micromonospora sediminimaris TaxID=547162 RepID=UPI001E34CB23|nr:hypothetical protein [Micromonospora sediminimaris]
MRKPLLTLTAAAATVVALAAPAAAAPSGDTIVTFTVSTANLDIAVPPAVNLVPPSPAPASPVNSATSRSPTAGRR